MFTNMEQWAEIRRRVLSGEISKRQACREYELHWQTLQKILEQSEPTPFRTKAPRMRPLLEPSSRSSTGGSTPTGRCPRSSVTRRNGSTNACATSTATPGAAASRGGRGVAAVEGGGVRAAGAAAGRENQADFGEAQAVVAGERVTAAFLVVTQPYSDAFFVAAYRLEVGCSPGTGKLKIAGGIEGVMKESIQRAFAYLQGQKVKLGVGQLIDTTDFHVEAIDLLANHVPCEAGIALVVAIYSAVKKHSALAGLLVLGDTTIQGNIKPVRSLTEPLQVGMDNGARKALIPLENKRNFLEVSGDIMEKVDPIFYSDPTTAAMKSLGMN